MRTLLILAVLMISCEETIDYLSYVQECKQNPTYTLKESKALTMSFTYGKLLCSASYIGNKAFLTAKHCFVASEGREGIWSVIIEGLSYEVKGFVVDSNKDIAVFWIDEEVNIEPNELADEIKDNYDYLMISGIFTSSVTKYLGEIDYHRGYIVYSDSQFAMCGKTRLGDSGGPIWDSEGKLVGVIKGELDWGKGKEQNSVGNFMDLEWVRRVIE